MTIFLNFFCKKINGPMGTIKVMKGYKNIIIFENDAFVGCRIIICIDHERENRRNKIDGRFSETFCFTFKSHNKRWRTLIFGHYTLTLIEELDIPGRTPLNS